MLSLRWLSLKNNVQIKAWPIWTIVNLLEQSGVSIRHGQNTEWTQWFIIRVPIIGRHSLSVFGSAYYIKQNPLLGLPLCYSYVMQWPFKQRNTTSIIQYLKRNPYLLKKAASVLIKSSFTCILTNLKMCQLSKHQQWKALSRRGE